MARIDEAFRLAGEAMAAGMRYNSERVLQGSRQFRRGYVGPVTAQVHDFDQRLRATFVLTWAGRRALLCLGTVAC